MGTRFGYADTPFGQLHYAYAGDGDPIVLLHHTPRSSDEFAELLPLLAPNHRAVAMDMVGFGQSAKLTAPQRIEDYAAGVVALMDSLQIERTALLGHHTGAVVAIEVAAAVPERVTAVVLSSPAYTDAIYRRTHAVSRGVDDAPITDDGGHLRDLWAQRLPYYPPGRPDLLNRFIRDCLAPGVDPREGHRACARYRMEDRISSVVAPVLILAAEADPFAMPALAPVREALTGASTVEVNRLPGGTIPLIEQMPRAVADAVTAFLHRACALRSCAAQGTC